MIACDIRVSSPLALVLFSFILQSCSSTNKTFSTNTLSDRKVAFANISGPTDIAEKILDGSKGGDLQTIQNIFSRNNRGKIKLIFKIFKYKLLTKKNCDIEVCCLNSI